MLKVLDLFSGIGGFSLGLERTGGFKTVAFCEMDHRCQQVLHKHWLDTPCFSDVRSLDLRLLEQSGIEKPDVITGGFPCQDISVAGKGAGLEGERSGLWSEIVRLTEEIKPRYVIAENVANLRARGLTAVLQDLWEIGYDAEWHCIPAAAVGAPHRRDRIWIVAYPAEFGRSQERQDSGRGLEGGREEGEAAGPLQSRDAVADTDLNRPHRPGLSEVEGQSVPLASWSGGPVIRLSLPDSPQWEAEPNVGRVADGIPGRVDRLKQLGNSVVPQIPEIIGHALLRVS
jgi:DNA (cytosine-5)-methyltransferase 1